MKLFEPSFINYTFDYLRELIILNIIQKAIYFLKIGKNSSCFQGWILYSKKPFLCYMRVKSLHFLQLNYILHERKAMKLQSQPTIPYSTIHDFRFIQWFYIAKTRYVWNNLKIILISIVEARIKNKNH